MFIKEPKNFHDAIKPLVYFNCYVGMGPTRQPNQSNTVYSFMIFHTVIMTIFNWITIYTTLNSIAQIVNFENSSPMVLATYKTLVIANSGITVIAPFLEWLRKKRMKDWARKLLILEDTFRTVLGVKKQYREMYIRLSCKIVGILLVMLLVAFCDTVFSLEIELHMDIRSVLMFVSVAQTLHHPILVMLVLDVNFCTTIGYLEKIFRDANEGLLGLIEKSTASFSGERLFVISQKALRMTSEDKMKNPKGESLTSNKHYVLREIRKAHLEISKLSWDINRGFGIQNLISTAISFVMITGLLYTIYSAFLLDNFTSRKFKQVIPTAVWAAIYALKICMINHSCWIVSTEAKRTGEVIYEFLDSKVDNELQREIQEFGMQMLQNPVRFNACGFFTLDHTFIQGAVGSVTTYLVILIQMSNVSENLTSNSALVFNNTEIATDQ